MTDFHSHFLPAIDDGSDSVATSLQMLERWTEQRIERVAATPHFYADQNNPDRFLRRRAAAYDELREAMERRGGTYPEILLGAEVHFFDGMSATQALDDLCLENTNLLLLEMPFTKWSDRMLREVAGIRSRGLQPVAAHVERYMSFQPRRIMKRFLEMDILIQSNAEFFLSRHTTRTALHMLRDGQIHFLGSDAHNLTSRAPNLGPALELIEARLGVDALARLEELEELFGPEREFYP